MLKTVHEHSFEVDEANKLSFEFDSNSLIFNTSTVDFGLDLGMGNSADDDDDFSSMSSESATSTTTATPKSEL